MEKCDWFDIITFPVVILVFFLYIVFYIPAVALDRLIRGDIDENSKRRW